MSDTEYHAEAKKIAAEKYVAPKKSRAAVEYSEQVQQRCICGTMCVTQETGKRRPDGSVLRAKRTGIKCYACGNREPDMIYKQEKVANNPQAEQERVV